jgi:AraC-like DNA-binding protein
LFNPKLAWNIGETRTQFRNENPMNLAKVRIGSSQPALTTGMTPPSKSPLRRQAGARVVRVNFGTAGPAPAEAALSNSRLVEKLADSAMFHEFQHAFEDATRLPLTLRAVESWQLAHTQSRYQNGFCALMSQSNHTCSACLRLQQQTCEGANGAPGTLSCAFGLSETAVEVKSGHNTIAYLQTGQVFFKPPTPQQTQNALKQIKAWGLNLDDREVVRRYRETPVVRWSEYEATMRLLQFFAGQLGPLASQILLLHQSSEPAQITRARQIIEAQHRENLSLSAVARQAGMSKFSFCRNFKKVTGVGFSQYLSRVRVADAKRLLLNLNYRPSEIAFEAGFQSLTCFNRVFKTIAGESPTEYRRHLLHA